MRVCQVIAYIFRQSHLILQSKSFFAILATLLKVHSRFRTDVRQLVFPFIRFDIGIHTTQLLFNNDQTVINKVGGVHRYLVLIVYRVFVIHGNQHIQNIFGTRYGYVLQRQVDDRRRLTGQRHLKGIAISQSDLLPVPLTYSYRLPEIFIRIIQRRGHHQFTHRSRDRIVQCHFQALSLIRRETGQQNLSGRQRCRYQGKRLRSLRFREPYGYRRLRIQLFRPQPVLYRIADIQIQPFSHYRHQTLRLEDQHFVVHITFYIEHIQLFESCRLAEPSSLAIVFYQYRCRTCIDFRSPFQIQNSYSGTNQDRQNEPIPVGQHNMEKVTQVQFVFFSSQVDCFLFRIHL